MISSTKTYPSRDDLFREIARLRSDRTDLRAREAAATLGVTEAEYVAARAVAGEARPLEADARALLEGVARLGPVMASTRSSGAVLESIGTYGTPDVGERTGIVVGDNIDLRVFPSGWVSAYAVDDARDGGVLRSLQIFDADGVSAHEIYLRAESDGDAYDALVRDRALAGTHAETVPRATAPVSKKRDGDVDVGTYRQAYAAMTDTHDFFLVLRRFRLEREQGVRLADPRYVRALDPSAHRALFAAAAEGGVPLMLFVASDGMLQISSGPVSQPSYGGRWCDIIGARSNLHLDETTVARAWAVRKPTANGIVTSLECYAESGDLVLQIFGERNEGERERGAWHDLVTGLPGAPHAT